MAIGGDEPLLPFEIIVNILKRLPVKSIVRFRCVCKDWKNLFKSPSFIAEHLRHSDRKNPLLLLQEYNCYDRRAYFCLLDHKMEAVESFSTPPNWGVTGSCNGLLCVKIYLYRNGFPVYPMIREP
ncbi:F-box protein At3g07870-like [Neltuma alba]|uniref:F-box protein At3g07870-like n=1 Tax=Neltuma alba TaxID=207710 RepID=UPI0010A54FE1|nr:F-box protein At3g07870-like [Prosopis alba]XP_028754807.1 F-box protein At3g07870-like [Prosopis alba]